MCDEVWLELCVLSLLQGDFDSSEDRENRNDRQVSPAASSDWIAGYHTVTFSIIFVLIDKTAISCLFQ